MASDSLRVVIAGGGPAGLALANALEKANIDYVLLEGRNEIAPFLGASIATNANGLRILDQLGCADVIQENTNPMHFTRIWDFHDGHLIDKYMSLMMGHRRHGYPFTMMDRQFLLQTLYNNLDDKSRVLLNKKVINVDHSDQGVSVQCRDGTRYAGDVVIGADGVYSTVRNEMWRHMDNDHPGMAAKERTSMSAEYKCMFGVCKPVKGLEDVSGHFDRCIGRDVSALWTPAKDGRVFWFMCEKMDKVYQVPDIPTYTDADALDLAQRCGSMYCTDKVKFIDIWENRIWHRLFPLEEVFYEHWSYGRIACIGDAVHKWVPHLGSGGNHAIEDATVTANALYKLSRSKTRPNHQDIATALSKIRPRRRARAKASYTASNLMARIEATKSFKEWLLSYWIAPYFLTDFLMHRMTLGNIGAEKLEYLPDPPQSLTGTMAFNQNYGPGQRSQFRTRVLLALPLLLLAYVANRIFGGIIQHPAVGKTFAQVLASGQLQYHGHSWDLPTMTPPFNILVTFFSPSLLDVDPLQRLQAIAFLTDLAPLWLIWILESHRPANVMTFAWLPVLFGVAFQLKGIGVVGPLWFFLHSVQSPLSNYPALDWRMVNVAAAKTALVAVLVTLVVPSFAMYFLPDLGQRLQVNVVWQAFPVLTVVLHHLLRKMTVSDTTKYDRIRNVHADMPYIRFAIYALSAISAVTFNWVRFTSTASMAALVFPKWNVVNALLRGQSVDLDFLAATAAFLQVDEVVVFAAAFIWLALLAHDLKKAEMTSTAWWKIVVCAVVGTMLFGPGAVVAFAWFWRENLLATKKAKGSVGTTYVDVDRPEWSDLSRLQKFFASD